MQEAKLGLGKSDSLKDCDDKGENRCGKELIKRHRSVCINYFFTLVAKEFGFLYEFTLL